MFMIVKMRGTMLAVLTVFVFLFINQSLSLDVEPLYQSLDPEVDSMLAVTNYDDSGPTADEKYRYRRQAGNTNSSTQMPAGSRMTTPAMPPTPNVRPFPSFPFPTPAEIFNVTDNHQYYNSTFHSHGRRFFFDMTTDTRTKVVHTALSGSHLTAGEVALPFEFPFYGHNISKIYIATGGFVSLSTFFHQYLSATQYIAPLMGNFDPSLNASSRIQYAYNSTSFTIEWDDIHVQHIQDAGRFTFQTTLMSDGRIMFAYKTIPADINSITGGNGHKVTVGLSDGYYIDEPLYPGSYLVKRTIYHYSNVYLNTSYIRSNTAYILTPLKTCNVLRSCADCLEERSEIRFDCGWCYDLGRCSDGLDRHRQEWVEEGCPEDAQEKCSNSDLDFTALIVACVLIIGVMIVACAGCAIYAYKNPSSRSGQQLIHVQQRFRTVTQGVRRNPQDNYQESIVANMQEAKPTPPPAYTPPSSSAHDDSPVIPSPTLVGTTPPPVVFSATANGAPEIPVVITTSGGGGGGGGAPGAVVLGNGDAAALPSKADGNTQMSDC